MQKSFAVGAMDIIYWCMEYLRKTYTDSTVPITQQNYKNYYSLYKNCLNSIELFNDTSDFTVSVHVTDYQLKTMPNVNNYQSEADYTIDISAFNNHINQLLSEANVFVQLQKDLDEIGDKFDFIVIQGGMLLLHYSKQLLREQFPYSVNIYESFDMINSCSEGLKIIATNPKNVITLE